MTGPKEVKKITYHEETNLLSAANKWHCYIETKDGSKYEGEGYSKEKAEQNAMNVLRANS